MTPDRILQLGFGFFGAQALLTAVQFDLFTRLHQQPMRGAELAAALGLRARRVEDFFDALVALQLLERRGDGEAGVYSCTPEAAVYLNRDSEAYLGGILIMAGKRLYRYWADLPEALRSGEPQSEAKHQGKPLFEEIFADPVKLSEFCHAMAGISRFNFAKFCDVFPFSEYRVHLDVGASTGLLSRLAASKYPHLRCVAFDLPAVCPITEAAVQKAGLAHRIEVVSGSFLTDPLPPADLITMGQILHDWDLDKKRHIIRTAYQALAPGGALVVIENLIDDERRVNSFGLLMSLNMLVEFGAAFDYSFAEFATWCRDIGFCRCEKLAVHGACSAGIAYK